MNRLKRYSIVILSILLLLTTVGCQPTPETPPVVNKGDGSLEDKIRQTASPSEGSQEMVSYEELWEISTWEYEEELEHGGKLLVDANVLTPKAGELPVERNENGVELFFASFSALRNLKCGGLNASPVHFHKRLDLISDLLRGDALVFFCFPNFSLQKPTLVSDQNTDGNQGDGQKRNQ